MTDMTIGAPCSHFLRYAFPLLLGTFIQASIRTVCTYLLAPHFGNTPIVFACAIGWTAMLLFGVPYYFASCRKQALPQKETV